MGASLSCAGLPFLDSFAQQYADTFTILIVDTSSAHTVAGLRIPAHVALVFQPPSYPEVNPVERVWHDLRGKLAWQRWAHSDVLEDARMDWFDTYTAPVLQSLTAYPFLIAAIAVLLARMSWFFGR